MSAPPANRTIGHRRTTGGGYDPEGYQIPQGFADPVERAVFGWWQESSAEPASEAAPERLTVVLAVLVPDPEAYAPGDRIVVGGVEHEIEGDPADHRTGPFGYQPGGVVRARRVEG